MFGWLKDKSVASAPPSSSTPFLSTHVAARDGVNIPSRIAALTALFPKPSFDGAQDDSTGASTLKMVGPYGQQGMPESLAAWYVSQSFIGYPMCAILAQHWLIDKACSMPGRDAIRNGYTIVAVDGEQLNDEALRLLRRYDKAYRLSWNLEQYIRMGRIFGIRIALFKVDSTDPEYYEKPFNPDGVTPGSYKGIVQVDPYWCAPELNQGASAAPDTGHFFEPTWWLINGKRHHRSHLVIFRNAELPDILKPMYQYGGIPVTQRIMERVYAAERVANEAPLLAQSKRTNVWYTDMEAVTGQGEKAVQRLNEWIHYRDNFGIKLGDKESDLFEQHDTALNELDQVIMTQYQIVAAAANVPATKILGTQPKGFSSTGEYEESSYHEELESIQAHDLTPLVERHHLLVMLSFVMPKLGNQPDVTVSWNPTDTPSAEELSDINLKKAQTGQALVQSGAISSEDERRRIAQDPESGYGSLGLEDEPLPELEDSGNEPSNPLEDGHGETGK